MQAPRERPALLRAHLQGQVRPQADHAHRQGAARAAGREALAQSAPVRAVAPPLQRVARALRAR